MWDFTIFRIQYVLFSTIFGDDDAQWLMTDIVQWGWNYQPVSIWCAILADPHQKVSVEWVRCRMWQNMSWSISIPICFIHIHTHVGIHTHIQLNYDQQVETQCNTWEYSFTIFAFYSQRVNFILSHPSEGCPVSPAALAGARSNGPDGCKDGTRAAEKRVCLGGDGQKVGKNIPENK